MNDHFIYLGLRFLKLAEKKTNESRTYRFVVSCAQFGTPPVYRDVRLFEGLVPGVDISSVT